VLDTTNGIREFIVGTGGRSHYTFGTIKPNSEMRDNTSYGVLKLTLEATSYDWEFVPVEDDEFTDAGSTDCHAGAPNDPDYDGVLSAIDNCPNTANAAQQNSDAEIGNGASIAERDDTVPNAAPDPDGDACESDGDADNDGLTDASDPDAGGDVTYDDDGDGMAASGCLGGSDPADDGPSWDGNCDGVRDGVTPLTSSADADGDGLTDAQETRRWGTCPDATATVGLLDCAAVADPKDTDADGVGDCGEAYDTNGDGVVLFPTDGVNAVKASLLAAGAGAGQFGRDGVFDVDGNNVILFPSDGLSGVKAALVAGFCAP
jgi:hypothetical protein